MRRPRLITTTGALTLALLSTVQASGPAKAAVSLTPVRIVGGPGHAGLYGWDTATMRDGSVVVTDYWNMRVKRYSKSGVDLGTVVANDGRHQAPYGVAVDPRNDDIYIGDVDGGRNVDHYKADGTYVRSLGGPATFNYPAWLDVDSTGRVAVADSRGHKVVVYGSNGVQLFQFGTLGSGPGQFNNPRGVGFDASDRLYVADNNNRRVEVFTLGTTNATLVSQFSVSDAGGDLRGLTVDKAKGIVYVADGGAGYISKFALNGTPGVPSRFGGPGPFLNPGTFIGGARGVTVDGDGNVWVGDMPNFRVQKFSPAGSFLLAAPNPPAPPPDGGFNMPGGVAVDGAGNIFVTDTFNWRIQRFDPSGQFNLKWGHRGGGSSGFNYARGIAIDPATGDVLVGDTDNQAVERWSATGQHKWSAPGVKVFALDVAPDGRTFAADFQSNNVKVLSPGGSLVATFGTGLLANPRGIDVDPDGSIWVGSRGHGVVKHFSSTGVLLGQVGSPGSGDNQLASPADVESDANNVYVADQSTNKIKVFAKNGAFVGAFGGGGSSLGRLQSPQGLHLTAAGRLYVAESGGERIQEFAVGG